MQDTYVKPRMIDLRSLRMFNALLTLSLIPVGFYAFSETLYLFLQIKPLYPADMPSSLHGTVLLDATFLCLLTLCKQLYRAALFFGILIATISSHDLLMGLAGLETPYSYWIVDAINFPPNTRVHLPVSSTIAFLAIVFPTLYRQFSGTQLSAASLYTAGSLTFIVGGSPLITAIIQKQHGFDGPESAIESLRIPLQFMFIGSISYISSVLSIKPYVTADGLKKIVHIYIVMFGLTIITFYAIERNTVLKQRSSIQHSLSSFSSNLTERAEYITFNMVNEIQSLIFDPESTNKNYPNNITSNSMFAIGPVRTKFEKSPAGVKPKEIELALKDLENFNKVRINGQIQAYVGTTNDKLYLIASGIESNLKQHLWSFTSVDLSAMESMFFSAKTRSIVDIGICSSLSPHLLSATIDISLFNVKYDACAKGIIGRLIEPDSFSIIALVFCCALIHIAMLSIFVNMRRDSLRGYFSLIKESSAVGLLAIDNTGRIIDVNEAAALMLNIDRPYDPSMNISSFLESDVEIHLNEYSSHPTTINVLGNKRPVLLSSKEAVFEGNATRVITLIDKHAEAQAQQEISDRKEELEILLGSLSEGVIEVDSLGNIIYVNPAASELLQEDSSTLIGRALFRFVSSDANIEQLPSITRSFIYETLESGTFTKLENATLLRSDKTSFPVKLSCSAIFRGNEIYGAVIVFSDNTEAIANARMQRAHVERMAALNENLTTFTHIVTHDFQQPARTAATFASMAIEHFEAKEYDEVELMLPHIERGAMRLYVYVEALLEYLKSGPEDINLSKINVVRTIEESQENLDHKIRLSGAEIKIGDIPDVLGSYEPLSSIFQNLISNAITYVAPGVIPKISIWGLNNADGTVSVFVKDNGIGIEEVDRELAFQPSKRLVSPDAYEGSGMGLSIVSRLVEKLHGQVSILTSSEAGTTFEVKLLSVENKE